MASSHTHVPDFLVVRCMGLTCRTCAQGCIVPSLWSGDLLHIRVELQSDGIPACLPELLAQCKSAHCTERRRKCWELCK
jgi:hypothetical protein